MDVRVLYCSTTGSTKKIAGEIAKVLGVKAESVRGVKNFHPPELLVLGSGVYGGKTGKAMLSFISNLPPMDGKKVAVFDTSGEGAGKAAAEMKMLLKAKGVEIAGVFYCKGRSFFIFNRGHPSREEIFAARKFAADLCGKK